MASVSKIEEKKTKKKRKGGLIKICIFLIFLLIIGYFLNSHFNLGWLGSINKFKETVISSANSNTPDGDKNEIEDGLKVRVIDNELFQNGEKIKIADFLNMVEKNRKVIIISDEAQLIFYEQLINSIEEKGGIVIEE